MYKKIIIIGLSAFVVFACSQTQQTIKYENEVNINFGELHSFKMSDLLNLHHFVKLETNESCLIGEIKEFQIFNDRINLLDAYGSNSIFIFTMEGKHIATLYPKGNGPGEFILPSWFQIDENGYLIVLDKQLSRLLRYNLNDLTFVDEIIMPLMSPASFLNLSDDVYAYYYGLKNKMGDNKKQIFIATKDGNTDNRFLELGTKGKLLYESFTFYKYNNKSIFFPYISDKIYEIKKDSIFTRYNLSFGKNKLPDDAFFEKYGNQGTGTIMNNLLNGAQDYIRFIKVYENDDGLVVHYYIKKELYCGVWLKNENNFLHFKCNDVKDDLGIASKFPSIVGVHNNQFIGYLSPMDIDSKMVKHHQLKTLLEKTEEDDNPIIFFYSFQSH